MFHNRFQRFKHVSETFPNTVRTCSETFPNFQKCFQTMLPTIVSKRSNTCPTHVPKSFPNFQKTVPNFQTRVQKMFQNRFQTFKSFWIRICVLIRRNRAPMTQSTHGTNCAVLCMRTTVMGVVAAWSELGVAVGGCVGWGNVLAGCGWGPWLG